MRRFRTKLRIRVSYLIEVLLISLLHNGLEWAGCILSFLKTSLFLHTRKLDDPIFG